MKEDDSFTKISVLTFRKKILRTFYILYVSALRYFYSLFSSLGYQVYFGKISPKTDDGFQLYKILSNFSINLVFDVGANIGQFAADLRSTGFKGRIVSLEPLSEAHERLVKYSKSDRNWIVHPRTAIGDFEGNVDINVSANSGASSSILEMLDPHITSAPESAYINVENVSITTLDSIIDEYVSYTDEYFVKIDVQGYEWSVLKGANKTLDKAKGLLCEVSLVPLYEGQCLWLEIIEYLCGRGFKVWAIQKGFTDKKTGQALQLNIIFIRD
jgi:FkbM family methyltransferase